jgi:hypothetical protein
MTQEDQNAYQQTKAESDERDQDSFEPRQSRKTQSEVKLQIGESVCGRQPKPLHPIKAGRGARPAPASEGRHDLRDHRGDRLVRGFLSGVVKKKLKLKVESRKDGRDLTYRIKARASS